MTLNVGRREASQSAPFSIPRDSIPGMTRHERWNLRLGVWQVLFVWLIISGALVSSFFVGLMIGQDHGLKNALQEQSERIVRLPIAPQITGDSGSIDHGNKVSGVDNATKSERVAALPTPSTVIAKPLLESTRSRGEDETLLAGGQEIPPVAGFAAKPAGGELIASARRDEKTISPVKEQKSTINLIETKKEDKNDISRTQIAKTQNREDARALLGDIEGKKVDVKKTDLDINKAEVGKVDVKQAQGEPKQTETTQANSSVPAPVAKKIEVEKNKVLTDQSVVKGWYIQVAAVESNKEALSLQGRLKSAGVSSYVQDARVKNTRYYRVLAGPYSDRRQGEAALSKIKKASGTKGEPFLKRID